MIGIKSFASVTPKREKASSAIKSNTPRGR